MFQEVEGQDEVMERVWTGGQDAWVPHSALVLTHFALICLVPHRAEVQVLTRPTRLMRFKRVSSPPVLLALEDVGEGHDLGNF